MQMPFNICPQLKILWTTCGQNLLFKLVHIYYDLFKIPKKPRIYRYQQLPESQQPQLQ